MKKEIIDNLVKLKSSVATKISSNKRKIVGTTVTAPLIAASAMSGACAGGCPYGLTNDPFPGQCGRYIDADGDGICDLSMAATVSSTSASSQSQNTDAQNTVPNRDDDGSGIQSGDLDDGNASAVFDPGSDSLNGISSTDGTNYHIFPITLLLIGSYLFTYFLFKKGILKPQKHKRIWNLLLVGGYMGTGITGILLTLMINMGISTIYNQGITFWHAELSILMVIGTLIHLHIYRKPFKRMFKVLFDFKSDKKQDFPTSSLNNSK